MMDVIIRNGTIVYHNGQERADIGIEKGIIVAIASHISTTAPHEIDATSWHIFAGLIDPHVHFNEPGRTEWEGLASGTQALVAGGVTTFFDMPLNSNPPVTTLETLQAKLALMREKSLVNAYAWGGLIPQNLHELEGLHQHGVRWTIIRCMKERARLGHWAVFWRYMPKTMALPAGWRKWRKHTAKPASPTIWLHVL
jgi:allantoinase